MDGAHNGGSFCIPLTLCRGVVFVGGWLQRIQDVRSSPRSGRRGRGHLLSALLRAEVRATPQCRRETAPWTRGPGGWWKTGSGGFLVRSVPIGARGPCQYHSQGLGCGVQVQGAGRRLGCFWRPGDFFFAVWRALPTFIFALLQAECACQIQTQTRSFSR